jgi:hypothetical protein
LLAAVGELLPLSCEDDDLVIFNPTQVERVADQGHRSDKEEREGGIFAAHLLSENRHAVVVEDPSNLRTRLIVDQYFVRQVNDFDLRGIILSPFSIDRRDSELSGVEVLRPADHHHSLAKRGNRIRSDSQFFKVLINGQSCFGGELTWPLPIERERGVWTPGEWVHTSGPIELCRAGFHLVAEDPFRSWAIWGMTVYLAEAGRIYDWTRDKAVTDAVRLLRPVPRPIWWQAAVQFVEEELPRTRWFEPDGMPDSSWRLFTAPTWGEAHAAAYDAVLASTGGHAWQAGWSEAEDAARAAAKAAGRAVAAQVAVGKAWASATEILRVAARSIELDAPGNRPWGALEEANDISMFLRTVTLIQNICTDIFEGSRFGAKVATRWNAIRKGYIPVAEIDEVLYVYASE